MCVFDHFPKKIIVKSICKYVFKVISENNRYTRRVTRVTVSYRKISILSRYDPPPTLLSVPQ